MKKFLSVFVALAMVLSLFAGVGARSAKAAAVLTFTSVPATPGTFAGGINGVTGAAEVAGVTGVGQVTSLSPLMVTVGTAVYGTYSAVTRAWPDFPIDLDGTVTTAVALPVVGATVYVQLTSTNNILVGDVLTFSGGFVGTVAAVSPPYTTDVVTLTCGTAFAIAPTETVAITGPAFAATTTDTGWKTLGLKPISLSITSGVLHVGMGLNVVGTTIPAVVGVTALAAKAVITIAGTVTPGNVVSLVVNGTTVTYTVPAFGATTTTIATALKGLVNATTTTDITAANTGAVLTLTAATVGIVGNAYTYAISETGPAVPGALVLSAGQVSGTTNVLLSWTSTVTPATTFYIYRNQTGLIPTLGTNAPIASVASTVLAFTDITTAANQLYYYWVAAGTKLSLAAAITPTVATVVVPVIPGIAAVGTLTLTPAGNFVGGVDGSGALGVDAIGTVVSGSGTSYLVNVTTAGVGAFDLVNGTLGLHIIPGLTSTDTDWATTGIKTISFDTGNANTSFSIGGTIRVAGSSTNGKGVILSINTLGTIAVVNVTTAAVGVIGGIVYKGYAVDTTDTDWMTAGSQNIAFNTDPGVTFAVGDILHVYMLQAVPGTSATAFLIVSGTPVKGDIATVTWQDTLGASHTVSYTTVTGDTAASVALALSQLIHALDLTTGNVDATAAGNLITLTQDVAGVAGNGKTLTATSTAAVTPTLTIHTVGGLNSPAYVELGKTIKLVAVDATGAVISCTWTSVGSAAPAGPSAVVNTSGLVTADLALTGVTVVTANSGTATGVFAVVVIPVQIITSLKINLVPAVPVSITSQQFGALASNAAYSALDYTTQAVWTDALPVASIAAQTGLLTYSTDETGNVYASAGGITATANIKIAKGVVTLVTVVGPVTRVIVLTIGTDIVSVDGKATSVDAAPEIVEGRTFVPIRFIAETFGSTVTWLPETKGVTITLGDTTIGLQIGNKTVVINGKIIALEAAPYIKNSRTMVPLRVISESFGGDVAWDPAFRTITITYVLPVAPLVP